MSKSKNVNQNKVCVIVVEGLTDKQALQNILSKLLSPNQARIFVFHKDITSDNLSTPNNIVVKITEFISQQLKHQKLKFSDINRIIHLTDLDGCFIDDNCVVFDSVCEHPFYEGDVIKTKNVGAIVARNHSKAANINKLLTLKTFAFDKVIVPYSIYFMSCNLEHVLHNKNNLSDDEKITYATEFSESYLGKADQFICFLQNEEIIIKDTYENSWIFIKQNNNSLKRFTNINLIF